MLTTVAHVYHEEVQPWITMLHKKFLGNVGEMAVNSAHSLAFHRGLGVPLFPASSTPTSKYLDADSIAEFANTAFAKNNFAIAVNGADSGEVQKWIGEFFGEAPLQASASVSQTQTKYYGGEERIAHGSGNAMVLGFAGSSTFTGSSYKPEFAVLQTLLGGTSTIKWSPGFSLLSKVAQNHEGVSIKTKSNIYSDAGLLTIQINGSARQVGQAAHEAVKTLQGIASGVDKEALQKAKALAKFKQLEFGQNISAGLELTGAGLVHGDKAYQIDQVAKMVDDVTEASVKQVGTPQRNQAFSVTDTIIGCQVMSGTKGQCFVCRRPPLAAVCRRRWIEGVDRLLVNGTMSNVHRDSCCSVNTSLSVLLPVGHVL